MHRSKALTGNYLGEVVMRPRVLVNAIRSIIGRPLARHAVLYYYGQPDAYINEKFGYKQPETAK